MSDNGRVKPSTSPEEYWAAIEEELGETVRAYALGRVVPHERIAGKGILAGQNDWGLVFITDSSVYIDHGRQANWFERLITPGRASEETQRMALPFDSIEDVVIPDAPTGLRRFLTGSEAGVDIFLKEGPGVRVVLDRRGTGDQALLERLANLKSG